MVRSNRHVVWYVGTEGPGVLCVTLERLFVFLNIEEWGVVYLIIVK